MAAPTHSSSPPKSARASIKHHLRELQVAYESLQEQQAQVVAQAILSPTRRRATDPGSPALPPRCAVRSLPASPLPPRLPASAPSSPGPPPARPARSPTRAPWTADRLQQRRRQRSRSAAATPVVNAAQLHARLAASAGAEQPLDSYHQYAAQLFELRFCPLRTGVQEQRAAGAAALGVTQQQGAQAQRAEQEQERQQQAAFFLPPLSKQQPAQTVLLPRQPTQRLPPSAAPLEHQVAQCQAGPPPQEAPATPADRQQAAADTAAGSPRCGSGGSYQSFASEEGDVVQVASPMRGLPSVEQPGSTEAAAAQTNPPQPAAAGTEAAPPAASAHPSSGQGGEARQPAASPLPLLSAALQLLTSPAGQPCSPAGIPPLRLAFDQAARTSADAGLAQQAAQQATQQAAQLPADVADAAATEAAGDRATCSSAADASHAPAAHGVAARASVSSRDAPADVVHALQPAPDAAPPAASEAAAAGERQISAGVRVQALQRLKQLRLLQREDGAPAGPGLRSSCGEGMPQLAEQPAGQTAAGAAAAQQGQQLTAVQVVQPAAGQAAVEQQGHQAAERAERQEAEPSEALPQTQAVQQTSEPSRAQGRRFAQGEQQRDQQRSQQARQQAQQQAREPRHQHAQERQQHQRQAEAPAGEEGAQLKQPRLFLRRRSQVVPMQTLPDWKAVRPKTITRWEGGGSGASTPGASTPAAGTPRGSTPHPASQPGTPTASGMAAGRGMQQAAQPERLRPATASRVGDPAGASSSVARPRTAGWSSSSAEPVTYALTPAVASSADGRNGRAAGSRQALGQQQPSRNGGTREDAPRGGGSRQPKCGGSSSGSGGSARTTPFAPRPNSGESRQPWGHGPGGGGGPERRQPRLRSNPIYDASTLLPLSMEGLLAGSGSSGGGMPDLLAAGRLYAGSHPPRPGSHRLACGGGTPADKLLLPPGVAHRSARPEGAAAAEAAADGGPLDDLLCAVDRMLHHVERALD